MALVADTLAPIPRCQDTSHCADKRSTMTDNIPKSGDAAPVIPAGTEPTVFGQTAFPGQALADQTGLPEQGKPEGGQTPELTPKAAGATTFEELAAKKGWQSPDELAAAYANLEAQNKRVEMSLSDVIKARQEAVVQEPETLDTTGVETQEDAMKLLDKFVSKKIRPLEDRLALQNLLMNKETADAGQYLDRMAAIVRKEPNISWETAYKTAKYDSLGSQEREQGRKEAYQSIEAKAGAAGIQAGPRAEGWTVPSLTEAIKTGKVTLTEARKIINEIQQ